MQVSILTRATQVASSAAQTAGSAAQTAAVKTSYWAGRAVTALSGYAHTLASYAASAANVAWKAFGTVAGSVARTTTSFCSAQPYVALGLGAATTLALALVAMRHFRKV